MNTYKSLLSVFIAATLSFTFSTQASKATFLQGYLEKNNIIEFPNHSEDEEVPHLSRVIHTKTFPPNILPSHIVSKYSALTNPLNCYPKSYEGTWRCMTIITDSSMKTILADHNP